MRTWGWISTFNKELVCTLVCIPEVLPTGFFSALACKNMSLIHQISKISNLERQVLLSNIHSVSLHILNSPPEQESWAQASVSLAPPAGPDCLYHLLSVPWSTVQTLRAYSCRRFLSLAEQSPTTPLLRQTPEQEYKLQYIYTWRGRAKNTKLRWMRSIKDVF